MIDPRIARLVFGTELRQLLRDRRALVAAVLLPALLYPLILWAQGNFERISRETLAAREVTVALDLSRLGPVLAEEARAAIEGCTPVVVLEADAAPLLALDDAPDLDPAQRDRLRRAELERVHGGVADLLVTGEPLGEASAPLPAGVEGRSLLRLWFRVKEDASREAADRVATALDALEARHTTLAREAILGTDPSRGLDLEVVDLATDEQRSGAQLGMFLPLIAVLVLLSGGAYAALSVFAGERESGTLETLLVAPVPTGSVAAGKFAAVLLAGMVTLGANFASLAGCAAAGLGGLPGASDGGVGLVRVLSSLVYLPGCVLVCALLCLVCGRAKTFRQGQLTIFPVTLACALPTAAALQPGVEHGALLALVPFTGPALSLRDALRGELTWVPTLVMAVSHLGYAALLLSRLGHLLDAERALAGDGEAQRAARRSGGQRAQRWAFGSVLAIYVVGGWLQSLHLRWGLAATLWGVALPLALVMAWRGTRRGAGSVREQLFLRAPSPASLLGALLCLPGLAWFAVHLLRWQQTVLPLPGGEGAAAQAAAMFEGVPVAQLVFLFAISPGVCEELLFRGPVLSAFARDRRPVRAVLGSALFFAAAHASVHRLLPTFLLGALFGAAVLRTRSIWVGIVLHAGYDALVVLGGTGHLGRALGGWEPDGWSALGLVPGLWLLLARRPSQGGDSAQPAA